ncbi:MAG: 3'-5' exonuclease [Myxococcales bacterium]|nr:hypothetical protein [Myxococcales bacterium]HIK84228.1 hypothetical protein [Myxococcales bacterium]
MASDDSESKAEALNEAEQTIVEDEERLLAAVRDAVVSAIDRGRPGDRSELARRRMETLGVDLSEAKPDELAAIAAEVQRVRSATTASNLQQFPDLEQPYFAHMQLETERGVRDVLLGQVSFIDNARGVVIVDWRAAPVAEIFFHYAEGDDYEQQYPDRWVEGILRKRRIVAFDRGQLVQIQTREASLRRSAERTWIQDHGGRRPRFEGGEGGALAKRVIGTGRSGEKLPLISSLLDERQYEALTLDSTRPLLILGGAGCGKTTVALHRLAYLSYHHPDRFDPKKMIVIVPEEGLVRLTRSILEELAMETVRVTTVDAWFAEQARAVFPDLPERLAVTTPAAVIRLKRHRALCQILGRVADEAGLRCAEEIDRALETGDRFASLYEESDAEFPHGRLADAYAMWVVGAVDERSRAAETVFKEAVARFSDPENDRERLLGDRSLLEQVVERAGGDLPDHAVDRVLTHTRLQYSVTAEEEFAQIPEHRKRAVDGRPLDAGTPTEDAGSIDVEDFALLLELRRLKCGLSLAQERSASSYTHVVLDEAQELSDVELLVLGQTISAEGCVTVAGDPGQQIGVGADFGGWDAVMSALGQEQAAPVTLETSYRCTRPIVEFGHRVLGPLAPERLPIAAKEGAEVARTEVSSEMHASIVLGDALSELLARESGAQVAVIAREHETAKRLYEALHQHLAVRLVLDGRFSFKPGIDITSVSQVKGLEFDYVVIPDASDEVYPTDHQSRRMLHVAGTRAIHQLWLLTSGSWSRLVSE